MKIQLSLAISGREAKALKEAAEVQADLEEMGYVVVNPFELCLDLDYNDYRTPNFWWECTKRCCDSLANDNVDMLAVLCSSSNRNRSHGMNIEIEVAAKFGIPLVFPDYFSVSAALRGHSL
jgi:hypothetical protein